MRAVLNSSIVTINTKVTTVLEATFIFPLIKQMCETQKAANSLFNKSKIPLALLIFSSVYLFYGLCCLHTLKVPATSVFCRSEKLTPPEIFHNFEQNQNPELKYQCKIY